MNYCHTMWNANQHIYQKICMHPFNQELINGTLDSSIFAYYIEQDALYLQAFSKVLALIATKLDTIQDVMYILQQAYSTIELERTVVHDYFKKILAIEDSHRITSATLGYTSYLFATAHQKTPECGLASILPCFWIYYKLGVYSIPYISPDNPYKKWIDTYSSPIVEDVVHQLINIIDRYAENTTPRIQENMLVCFSQSFIWEYRFWDTAYISEDFSKIP